ncbi:putative yqcI protein [Rosellinia necatrix]|uniref:Putative yqcI protein n=1 Tax=Rosellinia necatrix TaxID=77044 RepID=A0A1W2TNW7_ROSNE|nr:putative yqcI protein [Rosellinia necatrix]
MMIDALLAAAWDKESFHTICVIILAITLTWACYHGRPGFFRKENSAPASPPTQRLWTRHEIAANFAPSSWQRQAFDAFGARMMLRDPQIFPCIYATKGFKASEHRYCFVDIPEPEPEPGRAVPAAVLDALAAAFGEYARSWRRCGPMTSLVVLTPPPATSGGDGGVQPSLEDDRRLFWELLRGMGDRDPQGWPARVPQDVASPAWTLAFGGERFVGLAMTPRYRRRLSRFCDGTVLAFQPIDIFQDLLGTPEKFASAVGKVRSLTDSLDQLPYSQDVIAVGDGRQSVSTMFFLSDDEKSWGSPYSKIRTVS